MAEYYCVTDVETDGLIAGLHSMLSLATVIVDEYGAILDRFTVNLEPLLDLRPDAETMAWHARHPEAFNETIRNQQPAYHAIERYLAWLDQRRDGHDLVFVADPAAFDSAFVRYYCWRFGHRDPFDHGALDLKTLFMALSNRPYGSCRSGARPPELKPHDRGIEHTALADALAEAHTFIVLLGQLRQWHWDSARLPGLQQLLAGAVR